MPPSCLSRLSAVCVFSHLLILYVVAATGKIGGWDTSPNVQYHIQTDEGPERYFRYQTSSGQYRKEKRLQDGSVVGTYGWVDADGYLRLRDYIADDKGYRIVRTKMVRVGSAGSDGGLDAGGVEAVRSNALPSTTTTPRPQPISLSDYLREKQREAGLVQAGLAGGVEVTPNGAPTSTPQPPLDYVRPTTYRPDTYSRPEVSYLRPNQLLARVRQSYSPEQQPYSEPSLYDQPYDGIALTENGFRYYLPRHYHEEETDPPTDSRTGSFGYVDPLGIRRVIYYNTNPGSGFVIRKNNRYVGFRSTPYDPRP